MRTTYWELRPGPDFGYIERLKPHLFCVSALGLDNLDIRLPHHLLSVFDGIPELLLGIVWVLARDPGCLGLTKLLLPMLGQEVILDVDEFAVFVDPEYVSKHIALEKRLYTYHLKV